ncbi:hybrid sensor histidine kinase/response regulator [Halobacterium rubrum]|uniref:hybrid sensor histidine kinase/response regulator n=1 Tax=Halobacterium TaxID=2239 RepID=UPI001F025E16|nr:MULTISPECIES: response regulator [Halobacterium]MDH5020694.1 response regulator [Halobacterium rubrum]
MTERVRVLHVDDEPGFAELAAEFLEREDDRIEVVTATSAADGLDVLADEPVDCVVSDYDMPGRNGIEFLEAVRGDHPELPFVLFTGKGSEEVASDAFSAGATDYLQKEGGTDQYTLLANRVLNYVETAAAEAQRKRQLNAIEAAQEGISILDEDGEFIYVNEAYTDLYGYDREEMLGEHWELVYPDDEVSFGSDVVLSAVDEHGSWGGESVGERADGTTFVENHTVAATDAGELVCTVRDISDRKQRERALAALHDAATDLEAADSEAAVYEVLLEAAEDILEFDLVAVDVEVDGALVQKAWTLDLDTEGYWEETPLEEDTFATRAYNRQETIVADDLRAYDITPADPEYRSALTVPIGDHGTFQAVSRETTAFDDADRELTELLVGHAREALEGLARERELRSRTEALERQNARLEEFATIVSHDLRAPLNVADGRLELAAEDCDSEHIQVVQRSLDRMDALITDTLALARQGQLVTDTESVSVGSVAEECWGRLTTGDAELEVVEGGTVAADPQRLQQVVENLARNAIEHGGSGVNVRVGVTDDGFYVADDGPGIPAADRVEVFERGFTTSDDGTGYGLAIVAEIADAHGWSVSVGDSDSGGARIDVVTADSDETGGEGDGDETAESDASGSVDA